MFCAPGMASEVQRMEMIPGADEHHHFCAEVRLVLSSTVFLLPGEVAVRHCCLFLCPWKKGQKAKRVCTHVCDAVALSSSEGYLTGSASAGDLG